MKNKQVTGKKNLTLDEAYQLARKYQREGRVEQARTIFQKILAVEPQHANALFALGIIAFREASLGEAESLFRQAAEINPRDGRYALNLGVVLDRQGDLEAAEACYRQSIAAAADSAVAYFSLGVALQKQARLVEAEQAYRRALELNPDYSKAQANLVWALCRLQRLDEAETLLQPLLEKIPGDPGVLLCQGQLLKARNDFLAAEEPLRRSVGIREDVGALIALSYVLRHSNRPAEAEPLMRRAFELAGDKPGVLWELVQSHRFEAGDPLLERLEALPEHSPAGQLADIGRLFMLAKAYDDLNRLEDAVRCARRANDLVFSDYPFATDPQLRAIELTIANYREPAMCPVPATDGPVPIFIVGESRAGKTLVESLLASQKGVYAAGESIDLLDACRQLSHRQQDPSGAGVQELRLSPDQSAVFGAGYLEQLRARAPGARWVTSTLPGYYMLVSFIFSTLPGARVIHCHRDPLDQCVEMYLRPYGNPGMGYTSNPAVLAAHYKGYQRMMAHWRAVYGERILDVRYEAMVADADDTARRVYDYCGITNTSGKCAVQFNSQGVGRGQQYAPWLPELVQGLRGDH